MIRDFGRRATYFLAFPPIRDFHEKRYLNKVLKDPPAHVAVIMDGNGRWAKKRGLSRLRGHQVGSKATKQTVIAAIEAKVKYLTIYVFSAENWKRPADEVNNLMDLFVRVLENEIDELNENGVCIQIIGNRSGLPQQIVQSFNAAHERTKNNNTLYLNLALNYGGRQEIISAVNICLNKASKKENITEKDIADNLYTAGMPDPDLVIRTGGDVRISNYLLWQSAYSEYYFSQTLWPDFTKAEFFHAIIDLKKRERRFGGLNT